MKKLGEQIRRLREEKGLSQEVLAEKLDVSRQTVSNWENDRATPDAYKLKQLCEILGISANGILEMEERDFIAGEEKSELSKEDSDFVEQKNDKRQVWRILLIAAIGVIAVFLLAVAIVLFTLPDEEKAQVITSAFTLTPTMGGAFLLVLIAALLVACTVILFKRR